MSLEFARRFPPSCPMGYTHADLEAHFGAKQGQPHSLWEQLAGQTGVICDGRKYNHGIDAYEPDVCADHPHGFIVYVGDVEEWFRGQPVSDW